jgi:transcriptional regulator with XRE-family HTH domain
MIKEKRARRTVAQDGPNPVDVHVGSRIRLRRRVLNLTQLQLSDLLGITFQQVQKYEKGVNRIGAGRLYSIASILGVDISYFYSDLDSTSFSLLNEEDAPSGIGFLQEDVVEQQFNPMSGAEATVLLKAFYALPPKARSALLVMLTNLRDKEDFNSEA